MARQRRAHVIERQERIRNHERGGGERQGRRARRRQSLEPRRRFVSHVADQPGRSAPQVRSRELEPRQPPLERAQRITGHALRGAIHGQCALFERDLVAPPDSDERVATHSLAPRHALQQEYRIELAQLEERGDRCVEVGRDLAARFERHHGHRIGVERSKKNPPDLLRWVASRFERSRFATRRPPVARTTSTR